jgi:hypothetical protein
MLLIDPAHPPLWRSPDVLQFGLDRDAEIEEPTAWQQRMIVELQRGVPEQALEPLAIALGGSRSDAAALLDVLKPVLVPAQPAPPATAHVRTVGVPGAAPGLVAAALAAAGIHPPQAATRADVVVLVSAHVTAPADAVALMREDVRHLPVVFTGAGATVGPLVEPGRTACLLCVEAEQRDADPAWPALAAQLLHRDGHPVRDSLALEAGLAAAHLISERGRTTGSSRSLQLSAVSLQRRWRVHRPHAECACRSPEGNATASGPRAGRHRVPMTPTASARPA